LLAASAELLGIDHKGVDGLGVWRDECVAVVWEWRRHGREGRKGSGSSSNGARGLLLLLVHGYPLSHSSGVGGATIFGDMVAGMTLVATDLSFPWIWMVMHWRCGGLALQLFDVNFDVVRAVTGILHEGFKKGDKEIEDGDYPSNNTIACGCISLEGVTKCLP